MNEISRIQTLLRPHEYYRHRRGKLFTTYLALALKRMVARGSTDVENVMGFKVSHLNLKTLCQLFDEIFIDCVYYFRTANATPSIIDCGSNIGMSILFFKKLYPGARVVGFEPDLDTYGRLEENIRLNNLQQVTVHNRAVSDRDGRITFYTDPDPSGSLETSILGERTSGRKHEVEAVRLSQFITEEVDLLKMDIEGAENLVMRELAAADKLTRIREMFIEYHHHFLDKDNDTLSEILQILEEHGFGYQIYSNYRIPFVRELLQNFVIYAYRK